MEIYIDNMLVKTMEDDRLFSDLGAVINCL